MKVRLDFVSNSSSTSYLLACKMQYLDAVLKDLSRACTNRYDPYHDKGLAKRNKNILDFCTRTFELAFLGGLVIETRDEVYDLEYFQKLYSNNTYYSCDRALKEWNNYKDKVLGKVQLSPWDSAKDDVYDSKTDTIIRHEKKQVRGVVVSHEVMESRFRRYHFGTSPDPKDVVDLRVKKIVELAKATAAGLDDSAAAPYSAVSSIDTYQITQDTIDNTRELLEYGHELMFEEWEDLDRLEAKIKNGDALFAVRIAHQGDGYGDFYIYREDGADGLNGISGIEVVAVECS